MAASRTKKPIEWIGGIVPMPGRVTGEGRPYRPEAFLLLGATGHILWCEVGRPGELIAEVGEQLRAAIAAPKHGRPHAPHRIRVASPDLADALRAAAVGPTILVAPTPEIDEVMASMRASMPGRDGPLTYLDGGVDPGAVASFFRAATAFHRARPWTIVPSAERVFGVTIEALGVRDLVVVVVGQTLRSRGLLVFDDVARFVAYFGAQADAVQRGEELEEVSPHLLFEYQSREEHEPELVEEVDRHGWELPERDAIPLLQAIEADLAVRAPSADELRGVEAILLALPRVLAERKAVLDAWEGGAPVTRTLTLETWGGELDVTVAVPHPDHAGIPIAGLLDELLDLEDAIELSEEEQQQRWADLHDELFERFGASEEGRVLADDRGARLLVDAAWQQGRGTIASLDAHGLALILDELIPRHVMIEPSEAEVTVVGLRALYAFLKRAHGLPQADACLRVLGGDAIARFAAALADPRRFGPGKAILHAGRRAGYDVITEEGVRAWMAVAQTRPIDLGALGSERGVRPSPGAAAAREKKKARRKAAAKARRKSR